MYVTREQLTVPDTRTFDFVGRDRKELKLLEGQKGFQQRLLLNSLGHPEKFTLFNDWASPEDFHAFYRGSDWDAFERESPNDTEVHRLGLTEAYELVHEVRKPGHTTAVVAVEWEIDSKRGNADIFERRNQQLFELVHAHTAGLVANQLLRFLGNSTRYLTVGLYGELEEARDRDKPHEIQAFYEDHPATRYTNAPRIVEYSLIVPYDD